MWTVTTNSFSVKTTLQAMDDLVVGISVGPGFAWLVTVDPKLLSD